MPTVAKKKNPYLQSAVTDWARTKRPMIRPGSGYTAFTPAQNRWVRKRTPGFVTEDSPGWNPATMGNRLGRRQIRRPNRKPYY